MNSPALFALTLLRLLTIAIVLIAGAQLTIDFVTETSPSALALIAFIGGILLHSAAIAAFHYIADRRNAELYERAAQARARATHSSMRMHTRSQAKLDALRAEIENNDHR